MWKLMGHPKMQKVTKALAEQFANMEPCPQDRKLSETRLRVYEKVIREGGFRPMSWAAAVCLETGATYRVNGKHTSILCSGLDLSKVQDLVAVVETYQCDTLQDVSRLYSTYDSRMQSRNASDVYRSFASCVPQLEGVPHGIISTGTSAIWYSKLQDAYGTVQPQERAEAILEHWDFILWAADVAGHSSGGVLRRMAVMAAMYSTFCRHRARSTEFWTAVREETGSEPGLPDRKLAKYLCFLSRPTASKRRDQRGRVRDREVFVKCLHAWNAWRAGETTNLNYHPAADVPDAK